MSLALAGWWHRLVEKIERNSDLFELVFEFLPYGRIFGHIELGKERLLAGTQICNHRRQTCLQFERGSVTPASVNTPKLLAGSQ